MTNSDNEQFKNRFPLATIAAKFVLLFSVFVVVLVYLEEKKVFESNNINNHTQKKWDAFYKFTKRNNVDVLLIGNSHLYTGINPKTLSSRLGANSFILASPGTSTADYYYSLKEALSRTKPKVVVIETYGINGTDPKKSSGSILTDQIKSFAARKNLPQKLASSTSLFEIKNLPYAWSTPIRNHEFLYTNLERIKANTEKKKKKRKKKSKKENELYLGRYIRFKTGISDSIVKLYDSLGAPVDGKQIKVIELDNQYMSSIEQLCKDNKIELVTLTLPMYDQHVKNYSSWKAEIAKVVTDSSNWIDMQDSIHYKGFDLTCFESTYALNQHMSYKGSLIATYKLADFITAHHGAILPNHKKDPKWRKLFYGVEGFFENNRPYDNDSTNIILYEKSNSKKDYLEILQIKGEENDQIIAKLVPKDPSTTKDLHKYTVRLNCTVLVKGKQYNSNVDLPFNKYHSVKDNLVFSQHYKSIKILKVQGIKFR